MMQCWQMDMAVTANTKELGSVFQVKSEKLLFFMESMLKVKLHNPPLLHS